MNSFSHALPFLDRNDNFAIGCAIPDWLGAVDRRCRVRKNGAEKLLEDSDPLVVNIAGGIIQHIDDDKWFHAGAKFTDLSMVFAVELRDLLVGEAGFRPGFLGHIIIELLLDGFLHENYPGQLDRFYEMVRAADSNAIQDAVNLMATRPTTKLAEYFEVFNREKYLYDYNDDERLMYRVNYVLRRVKLNPVDDRVVNWVPSARKRVYDSVNELLIEYPMEVVAKS